MFFLCRLLQKGNIKATFWPRWNNLVPFRPNHGHQRRNLRRPLPGTTRGGETWNKNTRQEHETGNIQCCLCASPGVCNARTLQTRPSGKETGPKTTVKLWWASNKTLNTFLFCSNEEGLFVIMVSLCLYS